MEKNRHLAFFSLPVTKALRKALKPNTRIVRGHWATVF